MLQIMVLWLLPIITLYSLVKGKVSSALHLVNREVHPGGGFVCVKERERERGTALPFLTLALDEVGAQPHAHAASPLGKQP
jgi:hypothetical protein